MRTTPIGTLKALLVLGAATSAQAAEGLLESGTHVLVVRLTAADAATVYLEPSSHPTHTAASHRWDGSALPSTKFVSDWAR